MMRGDQHIAQITLDEHTVVRRDPNIEHERQVAIDDLLADNRFTPVSGIKGPFHLHLSVAENRLVLDIRDTKDQALEQVVLPLLPFRKLVKDYFIICGSYYSAVREASPAKIEAIDMGRRGLHDEGSEKLAERLAERVAIDDNTARRLFTLLCVLHIRG
ncbi:MAG TPA: UPF0262 family protein [Stellaceae bacterium]|jgi:uncharacterized protein (UPF0262 family)|nr:UPF0262 family protein [Stellaceae bacterium]